MRLPMSPALALLSLMACGQRELTHLSADEQAVIFSANELALDLMAAAPSEENLFIGSFSITSALGMTYAGAAGQTAEEMADVMHVNVDDATFHTALGAISRDLNGQHKGYDLLSGNRLWGQKRLGFEPDFLEITDSDYGAELKELDFARDSEGARRDINRWVSRETNGHIDEALRRDDVDRDTRLALTNVMYFHADWADAFEADATSPQDFTLTSGEVVRAPMMSGTKPAGLYVDEEVSVLRLPYKGEEISFVAILPAEPDGLAALEEGLSVSQLDAWLNRIDGGTADVDIQLPKFSMSDRLSLKPLLQDLGMPLAFDPEVADFSGMTDEAKLSIEDVIHEAHIDLDEEGTTAVAFTVVIMTDYTLSVRDQREFIADHPFLFFIRDDVTGAILFIGRMVDPTLAQPAE
ncbi:MAG: serpin family protein [Deltaproteobacteria bacterium]|nr:serpin family protein [Deltaproteobacteria bacterium]